MAGDSPIGLFDSGVGGLAVLRKLRESLPAESVVYLGDTARVPYGTKSHRSVRRYARRAAAHLVERGVKLLLVACNTVSAVALDDLRKEFGPLPVVGVIEPTAQEAVRRSRSGRHLVLATEATIERHAYREAIRRHDADARILEVACSLFVSLAEEGWTDGPVVEAIAGEYLAGARGLPAGERADCVILGCTHFGLLEGAIRRSLGGSVSLVHSARAAVSAVQAALDHHGLQAPPGARGEVTYLVTDQPERFARVGGAFLGSPLAGSEIQWIDL